MLNKFSLEYILKEGERLGVPREKRRALIREYLQCKILYYLYNKRESRFLSFIGGSSLRILRNLDRFSEDLDFDNLGLFYSQIKVLFWRVAEDIKREGFSIEFSFKKTDDSGIGYIKFLDLLFTLDISRHKDEKLMIKLDYTTPKVRSKTEILVLNRFGLIQSVVTNTGERILAQKIKAILERPELLPRDFYDVIWLISHNIHPDNRYLKGVGLKNEKEAYKKLGEIYSQKVKPNLKKFKEKLKPFLISPQNTRFLDMFGDLIKQKL